MIGTRKRAAVALTIAIGAVTSLVGHASHAAASTGGCVGAETWDFNGPLGLPGITVPGSAGTWTLNHATVAGIGTGNCLGVVVGPPVEVIPALLQTRASQSGTYSGDCLFASLNDNTSVLIGGTVAVIAQTSPIQAVFVHVMAPITPCDESTAVGVGVSAGN